MEEIMLQEELSGAGVGVSIGTGTVVVVAADVEVDPDEHGIPQSSSQQHALPDAASS
jgi:hypothetical protein